jgi:hypothetical protein
MPEDTNPNDPAAGLVSGFAEPTCDRVDIPVAEFNLTGVGEVTYVIGGSGEILSVTRAGGPTVSVPPVQSTAKN